MESEKIDTISKVRQEWFRVLFHKDGPGINGNLFKTADEARNWGLSEGEHDHSVEWVIVQKKKNFTNSAPWENVEVIRMKEGMEVT